MKRTASKLISLLEEGGHGVVDSCARTCCAFVAALLGVRHPESELISPVELSRWLTTVMRYAKQFNVDMLVLK